MISKNIVFTEINTVKLLEEEIVPPKKHEVLIKLAVSTISSGTERANLTGSKTVSWIEPEAKTAVFPRRGGYSSSGTILQIGEDVTEFKVGDRVSLSWTTHNQYVTTSIDNIYSIDRVAFEDAALFHIATFPLAAIRKCRLEIGESAVVMGMGILGIVAVKLLKSAGAVQIIAVDPNPEKREKAIVCGADFALDPHSSDFAERVKIITNGGANVGIEVTGIGAGLDGILDCMAGFGRVALLGCTRDSNFNIDYYRKVHGPGVSLIGAHTHARPNAESFSGLWSQKDDILCLKRLCENGRINLKDIVDEVYSPVDAPIVYKKLINEPAFPVVQFDWRKL